MPSLYAHLRFGRDVFKCIPPYEKKIISSYRELYSWGLLGPDIFFYYQPFGLKNSIAGEIHSKAGIDFFTKTGKKIVSSNFSPEMTAYVYGFICHFALDIQCHEHIYSKHDISGFSHFMIENEFDRMLLYHDGYTPAYTKFTADLVPDKSSSYTITRIFRGLSSVQMLKAQRRCLALNFPVLAPFDLKYRLLSFFVRHKGSYRAENGIVTARSLPHRYLDSNHIMLKSYYRAVKIAAELISDYYDNISGSKKWSQFYNYNFHSKKII